MRNLRLALLGLAAISALLLGLGFLQRAFKPETVLPATVPAPESSGPPVAETATNPPSPTPAVKEARQKIEAIIATAPDYGRFFDRLRVVFPDDYDRILDSLAKDTATAQKPPTADVLLTDAVTALRRANGSFAAKAPDAALARIFAMQLKEIQVLAQRDAHLCVAFLFGANGAGLLDFAASHRDLVADAAISGLDAMNSGRESPTSRGMPGDADFQTLDKGLTDKGLSRAEIETLLDGKTANPPISDERMCAAGQIYLETLRGLDPAVRGRLYSLAVDLMVKS
ncbi:MAG: hypothetical protein P4L76_04940 [Beijerinckiaceae bacterium]|nr:hypothetical protein [Beijerinckiaceae bacterium]